MWGYAAALLGVAYSGCDRVKTVALIGIAVAAHGGKFSGFLVNIIDLTPNYAPILMGIINTVSSLPGFFAPWVAGIIINDDVSKLHIHSFVFVNVCLFDRHIVKCLLHSAVSMFKL